MQFKIDFAPRNASAIGKNTSTSIGKRMMKSKMYTIFSMTLAHGCLYGAYFSEPHPNGLNGRK